jgi:putative Holliday junction resolvase
MRLIGVDFGDRRTGIAVSDPFGWTAQGLETFTGDAAAAVARIAMLAVSYEAASIVVGYPLNMNGTTGERARRTDMFIYALVEKLNAIDRSAEIIRWDERLTSRAAARTIKESGKRPTSRGTREKGQLDKLSAVILLQSYLDSITRSD